MPRRTNSGERSAFRLVQQQARELLGSLRREIRTKELELKRLKDEESRLDMLTGRGALQAVADNRNAASGSGRINWRNVLNQMPKQFKASNIRAVRGLRDKRPSEIFAAITRWIDAGMVKRKARGVYERSV